MQWKLMVLFALLAFGCGPGETDVFDPLGEDAGREDDAGGQAADMGSSSNDTGRVDEPDAAVADMSTPDAGDSDLDMGTPGPAGPTRYPHDELLSPVTASLVDTMRGIRANSGSPDDSVFMKVGASGTVNTFNLSCFGPSSSYRVEGADEFQATIDRFNATTFSGRSSFDRVTNAAEVGRTASWVQTGTPSPIQQEISAINPRFALVNYGTNDMQQGITHATALWPFIANMRTLLDDLIAQGIVPVITGLNPRSDSATAALWVPTYNAATRGLAEQYQLPYLDLYNAVVGLPDMGLIGDGIHGNAYSNGGSQPCVFSAEGLQFNYNVRNQLTMRLLTDVAETVVDGAVAPDSQPVGWSGSGTSADPFIIDRLPFSHSWDTTMSNERAISDYPSCDTGQNESGPEVYYQLELSAQTPVRAMVFDDAADVDLHVSNGADPTACVERHDRLVDRTLPSGSHAITVDTYVTGAGTEQSGEYTLVVLACEAGDPDC